MNERHIHEIGSLSHSANALLLARDDKAKATAHLLLERIDQLLGVNAVLVNADSTVPDVIMREAEQRALESSFTAPSVTQDRINELLARVTYRYEHPEGTTATFAHAFLDGEFYLATGFSACVSPENYSRAIGEKYAGRQAQEKATGKLWELEGYALFQRLREPRCSGSTCGPVTTLEAR